MGIEIMNMKTITQLTKLVQQFDDEFELFALHERLSSALNSEKQRLGLAIEKSLPTSFEKKQRLDVTCEQLNEDASNLSLLVLTEMQRLGVTSVLNGMYRIRTLESSEKCLLQRVDYEYLEKREFGEVYVSIALRIHDERDMQMRHENDIEEPHPEEADVRVFISDAQLLLKELITIEIYNDENISNDDLHYYVKNLAFFVQEEMESVFSWKLRVNSELYELRDVKHDGDDEFSTEICMRKFVINFETAGDMTFYVPLQDPLISRDDAICFISEIKPIVKMLARNPKAAHMSLLEKLISSDAEGVELVKELIKARG